MTFTVPMIDREDLESLPSPQLVIFKDRLLANLDGIPNGRKSGPPETTLQDSQDGFGHSPVGGTRCRQA